MNDADIPASLSAQQRALLAVRRMRAKLEAIEREQHEAIAVIGIGCRFPGGVHSPLAFWQFLRDGTDGITACSGRRWHLDAFYERHPDLPGRIATEWCGFIDDIDGFDAAFFGIAPREAVSMDPQQRLVLEVAWEALEAAGQDIDRLAGSQTGVFLGICNVDYSPMTSFDPLTIDPYSSSGTSYSVAAGRLSYLLDFRGPSVALDTACSSSLVAIHAACQSLRSRESDLVLAGGVNLILSPLPTIALAKWGMLSPDSRCKTFDAAANGFVRGEGCGVLVLKRLSDALADHDPVLALIHGSAVNQDGHSNGLTAPNGQAQTAVLRAALRSARLQPADLSYVEAHGTGTPLGDPIEMAALAEVIGQTTDGNEPCLVGSVKTNIGHLEAAAGVAGVIKAVLALQHEEIPPHLHLERLNPSISLDGTRLVIPLTPHPWPRSDRPRYAGVSSFGFSGTNAHVILGEAPLPPTDPPAARDRPLPYVLPISTRSPAALPTAARRFQESLHQMTAAAEAICYTAGVRRTHHSHRLAVCGWSPTGLAEELQRAIDGGGRSTFDTPSARPTIVFVFPGQGAQWADMGQQLYENEPVFRQAIDECDSIMQSHIQRSVRDDLCTAGSDLRLQDTAIAQPALCALEMALAVLWRSWGIAPDVVIGHSIGEIAAAAVAGALSVPEAARLACVRGSAMRQSHDQGRMLATGLSFQEATDLLDGMDAAVTIAATNGPHSTVLSGEEAAIDDLSRQLTITGVFNRLLEMPYAFHSPRMDACRDAFVREVGRVSPREAAVSMISTVTGSRVFGPELTSEYWARNIRDPVRFADAITEAAQAGEALFIEVGPHPVLASSITQTLVEMGGRGVTIASMRRGQDCLLTLRQALAEAYMAGAAVDWAALYPERSPCVSLPSYPWQHERFWLDDHSPFHLAGAGAPSPDRSATGKPDSDLLGVMHTSPLHPEEVSWQTTIQLEQSPEWGDHQVGGKTIVSAAAYTCLAFEACRRVFGDTGVRIERMDLPRALYLSADTTVQTQLILRRMTATEGVFDYFSQAGVGQWTLHAQGAVQTSETSAPSPGTVDLDRVRSRCPLHIDKADHYRVMASRQLTYGPTFQRLEELWLGEAEALARLQCPEGTSPFHLLHPGLLDAALQPLGHLLPGIGTGRTFVPVRLEGIAAAAMLPTELWVHAWMAPQAEGGTEDPVCHLTCCTAEGETLLTIEAIHFREVSSPLRWHPNWLRVPVWEQLPAPASRLPSGRWLLFADTHRAAERLGTLLRAHGHDIILVERGTAFRCLSDCHYVIDPARAKDYHRLIDETSRGMGSGYRGILHLWNLDLPSSLDGEDLEAWAAIGTTSALYLAQALGEAPPDTSGGLCFVTAAVHRVGEDEPVSPLRAPVWGLARVIGDERPDLRCRCVDLSSNPLDDLNDLCTEILAGSPDTVALRNGVRYARRLEPYDGRSQRACAIRPDGTYLITGGLGGLGLRVAAHFVREGARHLVLLSRGTASGEATAAIEALTAEGAQVLPATIDVTRAEEVDAVIAMIEAEMPALCGVIHAAGVLDDAAYFNLDHQRVWRVLAPKLLGAWHLHRSTADLPLDFFVMFSSAAALLASPGQANYAAANAFLDAFAHARSHRDRPTLSINWGPWSGIGMAASAAVARELAARGMPAIDPDEGVLALEHALRQSAPQLVILPLEATRTTTGSPSRDHPLLRASPDCSRPPGIVENVEQTIESFVYDQIVRILRLPRSALDHSTVLSNLGFDSLMSLELRSRLEATYGLTVPALLARNYPTVGALIRYLIEQLNDESPAALTHASVHAPVDKDAPSTRPIDSETGAERVSTGRREG